MKKVNIDNNSLAHTSWNCKYHIVFAPKYRRKVFFAEKRLEIREILRQLCQWKGVEIIEGEVCPDHIHMLVSIPPKMSVSGFMGYLKGKSALLIFQKFGNMKFAYRNREFWCKGYYVDTVGKNTKAIKEYIVAWLAGQSKAHLCAASSIRAMPETEIPPVLRGDFYSFDNSFRKAPSRKEAFSLACSGAGLLRNYANGRKCPEYLPAVDIFRLEETSS